MVGCWYLRRFRSKPAVSPSLPLASRRGYAPPLAAAARVSATRPPAASGRQQAPPHPLPAPPRAKSCSIIIFPISIQSPAQSSTLLLRPSEGVDQKLQTELSLIRGIYLRMVVLRSQTLDGEGLRLLSIYYSARTVTTALSCRNSGRQSFDAHASSIERNALCGSSPSEGSSRSIRRLMR